MITVYKGLCFTEFHDSIIDRVIDKWEKADNDKPVYVILPNRRKKDYYKKKILDRINSYQVNNLLTIEEFLQERFNYLVINNYLNVSVVEDYYIEAIIENLLNSEDINFNCEYISKLAKYDSFSSQIFNIIKEIKNSISSYLDYSKNDLTSYIKKSTVISD